MPSTPQMLLPAGHKYALLTIPLTHTRGLYSAELGEGYLASEHLPVSVPEHWQQWVGSLQYDAIAGAGYYLVAHAPATQLNVLDEENQRLRVKLLQFYTGLTIAVPNIGHEEAVYLSGAVHEKATDVREFTAYPPAFYAEGGRQSEINLSRLRAAKRIGKAIALFDRTRDMERLPRIVSAFRTAHQSQALDTRVHQFVRVIEGFVLPKSQSKVDEFAQRLSELVSGIPVDDLRQLYKIRSTVEHLRGPEVALHGTAHERRALLMLRAVQAEALARYLLGQFLDTPGLWPLFATPKATQEFWRRTVDEKAAVWPIRPSFFSVANEFRLPPYFWSTELEN